MGRWWGWRLNPCLVLLCHFLLQSSSPNCLSLCLQVGGAARGPFPKVSVEHCWEQSGVSGTLTTVYLYSHVCEFWLEIRIEMSQSPNSSKVPWLQFSPKEDCAGVSHGMGGSQKPWL